MKLFTVSLVCNSALVMLFAYAQTLTLDDDLACGWKLGKFFSHRRSTYEALTMTRTPKQDIYLY
jgi:hypothetical protein